MNQSIESDDELIALLERTMREVARLAPDMRVAEVRHNNRWIATAAAAAVVVVAGAAAGALVVSSRHDSSPVSTGADASRATIPATESPVTSPTSDTAYPGSLGTSPSAQLIGVPGDFPAVVPRPDTFDTMNMIILDNLAVGWEFHEQGAATKSIERCTKYAATFDDSWT
ncbi:MAG: hypothetical protein ABIP99_06620, partial [Ilumatobacteraceae bacterium]